MSTTAYRRYFDPPSGGATPPVVPAVDSSWTDVEDLVVRQLLSAAYLNPTNPVDICGVDEATVGTKVMLGRQYVGPVPRVGPMIGTFRGVIRCSSAFAGTAVDNLRVVVKVFAADGTTLRGTLFTGLSTAEVGSGTAATRTITGNLTPVTSQAGDLLSVEVGAIGSLTSGTNSGTTMYLGGNTPGSPDYAFADGSTAGGEVPWVELILEDPPLAPTGLGETADTLTTVDVAFSPPAGGTAPTSYERRVDGGAWTDLGLATSFTLSGLTSGTDYTVEVRGVAAPGPGTPASAVVGTERALPDMYVGATKVALLRHGTTNITRAFLGDQEL